MRVARWRLLAAVSLAALGIVESGCRPGECGEGTIEEGGVCVPASSITTPGECCGEGTHYDAALQACVSDFTPTVCEEGAPDPLVLEDGVLECCGCALYELCSLTCELARPGTASVCGTVRDMETGLAVARGGCMSASLCDPDEPEARGSCALEPRFFDAVDLAENGASATPLAVDALAWNACGAFAARSVALPASGLMAVLIDDASAHQPTRDDFVGVAALFPVADEQRVEGRDAFALRRDTDALWTEAAGDPFGSDTFGARGVEVVRFLREGDPVSGVSVTDEAGDPLGAAFYFSDPGETFAALDPAQLTTGVNGSALLAPDQAVAAHAEGGLPAECVWPAAVAEPISGLVVVSDRIAEVESTGAPCN